MARKDIARGSKPGRTHRSCACPLTVKNFARAPGAGLRHRNSRPSTCERTSMTTPTPEEIAWDFRKSLFMLNIALAAKAGDEGDLMEACNVAERELGSIIRSAVAAETVQATAAENERCARIADAATAKWREAADRAYNKMDVRDIPQAGPSQREIFMRQTRIVDVASDLAAAIRAKEPTE